MLVSVYVMLAIFVLVMIIIGGKQGIKAVISLSISVLALYYILVNLIFKGVNSIFASFVTVFIVIIATFVITEGINKKALTGILGSFFGTVLAGILALVFGNLSKLSGITNDVSQLGIDVENITFNFKNLIYTAIIIASSGACMDISTAVLNKLEEIRKKSEDIKWKDFFKSGMKVGKEVIGTMSNTLILVYISGLIKTILLYKVCNMQMNLIMNNETVIEQIVSAIAGSIGVICTIPLTAIIYAVINRKKTIYKTISENKIDGKRSLKI